LGRQTDRQDRQTRHGGRPQPRGLCVRWGQASPLNFRPVFIIVIVISLEHCTMLSRLVCSSSSFSILCILFLETFNRTQSVALRTVAPRRLAQIADAGVAN